MLMLTTRAVVKIRRERQVMAPVKANRVPFYPARIA